MSDQNQPQEGVLLPPGPSGHEGLSVGAGVDRGQVAVQVDAEKNLGNGWSVGGSWQWAKKQGNRAMGFLSWTPK